MKHHVGYCGLGMRAALLGALLAVLLGAGADAQNQAAVSQAAGSVLVVGTKHSPPFSIKNDDGSWGGISIELWKHLCNELDLEYEFRELTLQQILDGLERHEIDAGVAAISVTAERHGQIDFCHPHYSTGLGIAVSTRNQAGLWSSVRRVLTLRLTVFVGCMIGVVLICGLLFWLFERKQNKSAFGGGRRHGFGMGVWWSTVLLLGHKGIVPVSVWGRLLATVAMLSSIAILTLITGVVASVLTVRQLDVGITHPSDLRHVRLASISGSTSEEYLRARRFQFRASSSLQDALLAVDQGTADAVVYDDALLKYIVKLDYENRIDVLPFSFNIQEYAIALPANSDLRTPINEELLLFRATDAWSDLLYRYLGEIQ